MAGVPRHLRSRVIFFSVFTALALLATAAAAIKPKPPKSQVEDCRVTVHVFNRQKQAIPNAGVVLDQVGDLQWRKVKDPMHVELKSDLKGNATIGGFVPGVVMVQVIATNYQTTGNYYYVTKAEQTINIELRPPQPQVSIYH